MTFCYCHKMLEAIILKRRRTGAGEVAQLVRELVAAPAKDLYSVPSMHMVAYNCL